MCSVTKAINLLKEHSLFVRVLGSYPGSQLEPTPNQLLVYSVGRTYAVSLPSPLQGEGPGMRVDLPE